MSEDDGKSKDRVIDFSARKTEDEWAYSIQDFYENVTALWFKWLGWILATGGIAFLAKKTGSVPLLVIQAISYFLLNWYFLYFFASIRVEPYHSWVKSQSSKSNRFFALIPVLCLAIALTLGVHMLIEHIITQVKLGK